MIKVFVRFLGHLRSLTSKEVQIIEFDEEEVTIERLIQKVARRFGRENQEILLDPVTRSPQTNCLVIVNEREISVLDGLQTKLKDGDGVTIVPIFHGG